MDLTSQNEVGISTKLWCWWQFTPTDRIYYSHDSEADKRVLNTVEHDFNGHEVNGIHGVNGKMCYDRAFHLLNNLHDFNGKHGLSGNFCYDHFFRKTLAPLYKYLLSFKRHKSLFL